jgi:hypothetical protein
MSDMGSGRRGLTRLRQQMCPASSASGREHSASGMDLSAREGCIYCDQRPDQLIFQALFGLARPEDEPGGPPGSRRVATRPSTLSTMRISLCTDPTIPRRCIPPLPAGDEPWAPVWPRQYSRNRCLARAGAR